MSYRVDLVFHPCFPSLLQSILYVERVGTPASYDLSQEFLQLFDESQVNNRTTLNT